MIRKEGRRWRRKGGAPKEASMYLCLYAAEHGSIVVEVAS